MNINVDHILTVINGARKLREYYKEQMLEIHISRIHTIEMYLNELARHHKTLMLSVNQLRKELINESNEFRPEIIRQEMEKRKGKNNRNQGQLLWEVLENIGAKDIHPHKGR